MLVRCATRTEMMRRQQERRIFSHRMHCTERHRLSSDHHTKARRCCFKNASTPTARTGESAASKVLLLQVRVVSTNASACAAASPPAVPASQAARKGHGVTIVEQEACWARRMISCHARMQVSATDAPASLRSEHRPLTRCENIRLTSRRASRFTLSRIWEPPRSAPVSGRLRALPTWGPAAAP